MNRRLTHSLPAKVGAIFLMVILAFLILLSGIDMLAALYFGIYDRGVSSYYDTSQCRSEVIDDLHALYYMLNDGVTDISDHNYYGDYDACNLRFAGFHAQTGQYLSNDRQLQYALQQVIAAKSLSDPDFPLDYATKDPSGNDIIVTDPLVEPNSDPVVERSQDGRLLSNVFQWDINETYFIAGVVSPLSAQDAYFRQIRVFNMVYNTRILAPILFAIGLFAAVADLIFLCCAAGHRWDRDEITLNLQDRIPLDFYLFGMFWVFFFLLMLLIEFSYNFWNDVFLCTVIGCLTGVVLLLAALATLLTLCTRFKVGKWWRNTVIWWCGKLFVRICKAIGRGVRGFFRLFPLVWRSVALVCTLLFAQTMLTLLIYDTGDPAEWFLVTLVFDGGLVLLVMYLTRQLQHLQAAGKALAAGDFDQTIDLSRMRGSLREHGEHLNSLGEGLSIAVEQKMRSERLKTELITNVSHDIKTPLTSIINYVDLLQKKPAPEEQAEYLNVLDRQAKRLKKLTEDLVEASKASTGNLAVHLAPSSLGEIIDQAMGEYEDRLQKAGLDAVVVLPEESLTVLADGRLLWRVLDNLLNNACKYALSGTRIYLEAQAMDDRAILSMKNISRQQLNLSPDELMERFVRGDSSRNTEGSGLGLNIARSLVELQNGTFDLSIDGDLFKVILTLPLCEHSAM